MAQETLEFVENLEPEELEKLKNVHYMNYTGTDDDMPDAFDDWLENRSIEEIVAIIEQ